jgi:hypothetical protein
MTTDLFLGIFCHVDSLVHITCTVVRVTYVLPDRPVFRHHASLRTYGNGPFWTSFGNIVTLGR